MKNLILISMLTLASFANAQKGSYYVGGNIGFNNSNLDFENNNLFSTNISDYLWQFSPEFGIFATNKIQVGIGPTFNITRAIFSFENSNQLRSSSFNIGGTIYGRYFFGKKALKPFVGINTSFTSGTNKTESTSYYYSRKTISLNTKLNIGISYAITNKFSLMGSISVLGHKYLKINNDPSHFNNFGYNMSSIGSRINFGVFYTF